MRSCAAGAAGHRRVCALPPPPADADEGSTPSTVVLPISATENITLQRVRYSSDQHGCTWNGIVAETGETALLMRWNDGHITGLVGYKGRIYTIASLGGQLHSVVETDPRQMPPDHSAPKPTADPRADLRPDAPAKVAASATPPAVNPLSDADRRALEAKQIVIDVMILYTKKAASRYLRDPADLLEMATEQANQAFRNSGLGNISLRLVHTQTDRLRRIRRRALRPSLPHGRRSWRVQGRPQAAQRKESRYRRPHRRRSVGLRPVNAGGGGFGGRLFRRASLVRHDHDLDRARDRPYPRRAPRPRYRRQRRALRLWPWLRQRQVARHHELPAELRRLRAHPLLVEPTRHSTRTSRPAPMPRTMPA